MIGGHLPLAGARGYSYLALSEPAKDRVNSEFKKMCIKISWLRRGKFGIPHGNWMSGSYKRILVACFIFIYLSGLFFKKDYDLT